MTDLYVVSVFNQIDDKLEPVYCGNKSDVAAKIFSDIRVAMDKLDEKNILNYNVTVKLVPNLSGGIVMVDNIIENK